jgi:hypothetical protein
MTHRVPAKIAIIGNYQVVVPDVREKDKRADCRPVYCRMSMQEFSRLLRAGKISICKAPLHELQVIPLLT